MIFSHRLAAKALAFVLCCIADGLVLYTTWTGQQIQAGQFRRGYFEKFNGHVGLALDDSIRRIFPEFLVGDNGELVVAPGMTTVLSLGTGAVYQLSSASAFFPYLVLGAEAPVEPAARNLPSRPGEAKLLGGRTLALQEGQLAWVAWDAALPWREDAARLSALFEHCSEPGDASWLSAEIVADRLDIRVGHCTVVEPLPSPAPQLAALAGPHWLSIVRRPAWKAERWVIWQVPAVVVAKVAAMWWALGLVSVVATSAILGGAALFMPVAATLTWPLVLLIAVVAAIGKVVIIVVRRFPPRRRFRIAAITLVVIGWAIAVKITEPRPHPLTWRDRPDDGQPDACVVLGYSTVGDASLRFSRGGIRWLLNESCASCQNRTASLAAGGEILAWVRDAYCSSSPAFGAGGQVIFLGGANDDFSWGLLSLARLFIVGQQGPAVWQRNQASAAAASLAYVDAQAEALAELEQCTRARDARLLFLHDFLITDLVGGRGPERATMLERRRAVVQEAGGVFVDLLSHFGAAVGVSWFNDYVHPSLPFHERIADIACRQVSGPSAAAPGLGPRD